MSKAKNTILILLGIAAIGTGGFPNSRAATIQVTGPITGKVAWARANEYVLNKFVHVLDGAELHIEAGTVVRGKPGMDADTSALIICRGAKIFAEGTPTQPIIFTAEADDLSDPEDLDLYERGLWGGVVLMGKAVLNTTVDAAGNAASPKYEVYEGISDLEINGQRVHRFGGNDDNDSSGVMRYVSIRHGGVAFAPNKEINGLSLCGVGRGTTLEFIEVYGFADDGFEFFGGTVNTKHLVSAFNDDDAFDIDMGYRGKNQFWFALQEAGKKDSGGEWNGEPNEANSGAAPIANYQVWNATFIGAGATSSGNNGLTVRVYAAPEVYNSILTGFGGVGLRITDDKAGQYVTSGLMKFRENFWFGFKDAAAGDRAAVFFDTPAFNNQQVDPQLRGISRSANGGLDPRPQPASPALTPSSLVPPCDGYLEQVTYRGAFGQGNWLSDWTLLSAVGILNAAGGMNPIALPCQANEAPTIGATRDAANIVIAFDSQTGKTYQVQFRDLIGAGNWTNAGAPLAGTGQTITFPEPADAPARFYRVVIP